MRIIAKRTLRAFWEKHPDAEQPFQTWYRTVELAEWRRPADVKSYYGSASILANNRVCFNIAGNKYRLIVKIEYAFRIVYIRFVGTHAEYDAIDASRV
jgi:mRNA interferase HigB